jgi:hypothetical protein
MDHRPHRQRSGVPPGIRTHDLGRGEIVRRASRKEESAMDYNPHVQIATSPFHPRRPRSRFIRALTTMIASWPYSRTGFPAPHVAREHHPDAHRVRHRQQNAASSPTAWPPKANTRHHSFLFADVGRAFNQSARASRRRVNVLFIARGHWASRHFPQHRRGHQQFPHPALLGHPNPSDAVEMGKGRRCNGYNTSAPSVRQESSPPSMSIFANELPSTSAALLPREGADATIIATATCSPRPSEPSTSRT